MIDYTLSINLDKVDNFELGVISKEVELLSKVACHPVLETLINELKEEVKSLKNKRNNWE